VVVVTAGRDRDDFSGVKYKRRLAVVHSPPPPAVRIGEDEVCHGAWVGTEWFVGLEQEVAVAADDSVQADRVAYLTGKLDSVLAGLISYEDARSDLEDRSTGALSCELPGEAERFWQRPFGVTLQNRWTHRVGAGPRGRLRAVARYAATPTTAGGLSSRFDYGGALHCGAR
jgi:hypothetical protein